MHGARRGRSGKSDPTPFPTAGDTIRKLFDCVLVDEYQDTNADSRPRFSTGFRPRARGLRSSADGCPVDLRLPRGDIGQDVLDFPKHYADATVVTLEQNYRSTQPILAATNGVISLARERYTNLWSQRGAGKEISPSWSTAREDNADQVEIRYSIAIHRARRGSVDLRRQAGCSSNSHHSILLEAELARRRHSLPQVRWAGKFIEAAHVKDMMAFLRLAENPRGRRILGTRLLLLLPGVYGPGEGAGQLTAMLSARRRFQHLARNGGRRPTPRCSGRSSSRC